MLLSFREFVSIAVYVFEFVALAVIRRWVFAFHVVIMGRGVGW
jgi:hypothetical protein